MTDRFKEPSCTPRVTISQIDALNTRFSLSASPPHFVPFQEDRGVGLWLWFSVCYGHNNMFGIGTCSFPLSRKNQNLPDRRWAVLTMLRNVFGQWEKISCRLQIAVLRGILVGRSECCASHAFLEEHHERPCQPPTSVRREKRPGDSKSKVKVKQDKSRDT